MRYFLKLICIDILDIAVESIPVNQLKFEYLKIDMVFIQIKICKTYTCHTILFVSGGIS